MSKKNENTAVENNTTLSSPIPEVYTNTAIINCSEYEFEITLGLGSATYEGTRPVVNIRMSPQFAGEFSRILSENLKVYEDNFMKLPGMSVVKG